MTPFSTPEAVEDQARMWIDNPTNPTVNLNKISDLVVFLVLFLY